MGAEHGRAREGGGTAPVICIDLGGVDLGPLGEAVRGRGDALVTFGALPEGLAALGQASAAVIAAPAWAAAAEARDTLRAKARCLPLLILVPVGTPAAPPVAGDAPEEIVLPAPATPVQLAWALRAAHALAQARLEPGRSGAERGGAHAEDLGRALTATLDLQEVLDLIAHRLPELVACAFWHLLLVDERIEEVLLEVKMVEGTLREGEIRSPVGHGLVDTVARSGKPILVADAARDERCRLDAARFGALEVRSVAGLPLRARGRTLGVLLLANRQDGLPFDARDLARLDGLVAYGAIAIDNARRFERAKELALTDDLTQLGNLRYFTQMVDRELSRVRRRGGDLACLFLDLDHFKRVNDEHGHLMGSALLREAARLLRTAVRTMDVVARYGGDEFVLLLPDTGGEGAFKVAERLRLALAAETFLQAQGLAVRLTTSIGIAVYPVHARTRQELLQAADDAMYRAKGNQRNQTFYPRTLDDSGPPPDRP